MKLKIRNHYAFYILVSTVVACTSAPLPKIEKNAQQTPSTPTTPTPLPETPAGIDTPLPQPNAPINSVTPVAPNTPVLGNTNPTPITVPGTVTLPPSSNIPGSSTTLPPSSVATPPAITGAPTSSVSGDKFKLQDIVVKVPTGWKLHQDVAQPDIVILGFTNSSDDYFRMYVGKTSKDFSTMFSFKTQNVKPEFSETIGKYQWTRSENKKSSNQTSYVTSAFWMTYQGFYYYGFGRSNDQATAAQITQLFLSNLE